MNSNEGDEDYHADLDSAFDVIRDELSISAAHFDQPVSYRLNDLDAEAAACYGDSQRKNETNPRRYYAYHLPPGTGTPNGPGWDFDDEDSSIAILSNAHPVAYRGHVLSDHAEWTQVGQAEGSPLDAIMRIAAMAGQWEFFVYDEADAVYVRYEWVPSADQRSSNVFDRSQMRNGDGQLGTWRETGERYTVEELQAFEDLLGSRVPRAHAEPDIAVDEDAVIIDFEYDRNAHLLRATIEPGRVDWGAILSEMLTRFGDDVLEFLAHHYPDLDMHEYEGGVNYWWGIGSVAVDELGLSFSMSVSSSTTLIEIRR